MAIIKPYTFIAGTKARAGEVNKDFDILYDEVNRIGTEILGIDVDIQNISDSKADINGNATQRFKVANPEDSYDSVNKNYLENSILNVKDYISGLTIVKDTDNTIRVSSGSCYDSTYNTMIVSTGNITKENDNQGANLTYYVYIVSDTTGRQVDVLISTESDSPPRPTGFDLFRRIGSYTTNNDGNINIIIYYSYVSTTPQGIATIVETYINGPSFYRIYSDGFCEQWFEYTRESGGGISSISLLKPYKDTNFVAVKMAGVSDIGGNNDLIDTFFQVKIIDEGTISTYTASNIAYMKTARFYCAGYIY